MLRKRKVLKPTARVEIPIEEERWVPMGEYAYIDVNYLIRRLPMTVEVVEVLADRLILQMEVLPEEQRRLKQTNGYGTVELSCFVPILSPEKMP